MQVKLIEKAEALGKFIDSIAVRGKKMDGDIHIAAMSAASHFGQHGDTTYVNRLYKAMPKGSRHVALTAWFLQFAGVAANDDKGTNKAEPFRKDASKKVDLAQGAKTPWFTMKPSKTPDQVVDLLALTLKVIAKAQGDGKQIVHGAMLTELQALAEKYGAEAGEVEPEGEDADELAGVSAE